MSTADLVARLERLETQNRRLRRLTTLALDVGAAGLLVGIPRAGHAGPDKEKAIEAERLVLRDREGHQRVVLAAEADEAVLRFFDREERPRVVLTSKPPGLALSDEHGNVRAYLYQLGYGAGVDIRDRQGKVRAWLGERKEGPALQLLDQQGKPQFAKP